MKKTFPLLCCVILINGSSTICNAIDPVADYRRFIPSDIKGDYVLYEWKGNIAGDGKLAVFLTSKESVLEARHDGVVPSWSVYLPKLNGGGHMPLAGVDEGTGVSPVNSVEIDSDVMYIGPIEQLGKNGIVTIQTDHPRQTHAVAYIYAYTLEGDHLKKSKLAEYNPDQGVNPIYEKYLSEANRTKIHLQEVTP